jgi:hypothetical protein
MLKSLKTNEGIIEYFQNQHPTEISVDLYAKNSKDYAKD